MAALSEQALEASVQALTQRSRQLAYAVILRDQYIDEMETELDRLCLQFIARQQPVAGHLRFVFAAIQINRELERIGDYAESIARQVLVVSALEPQPPYGNFEALRDLALGMLRDAVRSFLERDADLAARTMAAEEKANTLRDSINAQLKDLRRVGQLPGASILPLMTVARRLERATDQTKNLCEEVLYMCTGEFIRHKGAQEFRILFVDLDNSCLSQMAEGLGRALHLPRFVFSSAGIQPSTVDTRVVEFMASKGMDISGQAAKSLAQLPGWEHSQVIVALGAPARDAMPAHVGKAICFTWPIADPGAARGAIEQVRPAFEDACQALQAHLRDLVAAILQEPSLKNTYET